MADKERTPWFGPHQVGIGWGPITWQGYLVCILAAIAVSAAVHFILHR